MTLERFIEVCGEGGLSERAARKFWNMAEVDGFNPELLFEDEKALLKTARQTIEAFPELARHAN